MSSPITSNESRPNVAFINQQTVLSAYSSRNYATSIKVEMLNKDFWVMRNSLYQ